MNSHSNSPDLKELRKQIEAQLKLAKKQNQAVAAKQAPSKEKQKEAIATQKEKSSDEEKKTAAASKIQDFWRKSRMAKSMVKDPISTHRSVRQHTTKKSQSHEEMLFDIFMFGRTVARAGRTPDASHATILYQTMQPFTQRPLYHRDDFLNADIGARAYVAEFTKTKEASYKGPSMPPYEKGGSYYLPITKLRNTNIQTFLTRFAPQLFSNGCKLVSGPTLNFLQIPYSMFYTTLAAQASRLCSKGGFSVSAWEISQAILPTYKSAKLVEVPIQAHQQVSKQLTLYDFAPMKEDVAPKSAELCVKFEKDNNLAYQVLDTKNQVQKGVIPETELKKKLGDSKFSLFVATLQMPPPQKWESLALKSECLNAVLEVTNERKHTEEKIPSTLQSLKNSPLMTKLDRLSRSNRSTNLLANSLLNMINGLSDNVDINTIQRLYIYLDIALKFYQNNYERFAYCCYVVVHELSLHLNQLMQQGELNPAFYQQFKNEACQNAISAFGSIDEKNTNVTRVAAPAVSGTSAFTIAMGLAEKMNVSSPPPVIRSINKQYFEFRTLYPEQDDKKPADIYLVTCGPVVEATGVNPGINLNEFIRQRILNNTNTLSKPVTIVIDTTTTLYNELKLDPGVLAHVESGGISLIVNESHQKFGLLHTDQAQYGRVYGICSNRSFNVSDLKQFEQNAEYDLMHHLDMLIGAYINIHCGGRILEGIKEQHFRNGLYFREVLTQAKAFDEPSNISGEYNRKSGENYFVTHNADLTDQAKKGFFETAVSQLAERDSFGHSKTSATNISSTLDKDKKILRIAAGASDEVDTILEATQVYLATSFTPQALFSFLSSLITPSDPSTKSTPRPVADQIIIFSAILALKASNYNPYSEASEAKSDAFLRNLRTTLNVSQNMSGRMCLTMARDYHSTLRKQYNDAVKNNTADKKITLERKT